MRKKGRLGSMQTGIGETILDVIFIFGLHSGMILAAFDSAVKLSHCLFYLQLKSELFRLEK